MKKLSIFLILFAQSTIALLAQNSFTYQAVVRDANGRLISEQSVTLNYTLQHNSGTETGSVAALGNNEFGRNAQTLTHVRDHQDNWYKVTQIGNQCWLRENQKTHNP